MYEVVLQPPTCSFLILPSDAHAAKKRIDSSRPAPLLEFYVPVICAAISQTEVGEYVDAVHDKLR